MLLWTRQESKKKIQKLAVAHLFFLISEYILKKNLILLVCFDYVHTQILNFTLMKFKTCFRFEIQIDNFFLSVQYHFESLKKQRAKPIFPLYRYLKF